MKRSHKEDKLAKIYDAEILPIWSRRFGKLLLRDLALPPKAMVLDVGCGTGYPSLEILRQDGRRGAHHRHRSVVADARRGARQGGAPRRASASSSAREIGARRSCRSPTTSTIWWCATPGCTSSTIPSAPIREFARVTKPGGRVAVTLPLAGTFDEFFDLFREVLIKLDRQDAIDRLDAYLTRYPPLEQVEALVRGRRPRRRAGASATPSRCCSSRAASSSSRRSSSTGRSRVEGDRRQGPADAGRVLALEGRPSTPTSPGGRFAVTVNAGSCAGARRSRTPRAPAARSRGGRRRRRSDRRGRAHHRRLRHRRRAEEAGGARRRRRRRAGGADLVTEPATSTKRWRAQIQEHDRRYYVDNNPTIADVEYDQLYKRAAGGRGGAPRVDRRLVADAARRAATCRRGFPRSSARCRCCRSTTPTTRPS